MRIRQPIRHLDMTALERQVINAETKRVLARYESGQTRTLRCRFCGIGLEFERGDLRNLHLHLLMVTDCRREMMAEHGV